MAVTAVPAPVPAAEAARLERGAYLVKIMGCHDCHTPLKLGPRGPEPDMSRALTGHPAEMIMPPAPALSGPWMWTGGATNTVFAGPWGVSFTANLTPDVETGLGKWTEEMFIATMKTASTRGRAGRCSRRCRWQQLAALEDGDIKALFAYLRSLTPVRNRVPAPIESARGGAAVTRRPRPRSRPFSWRCAIVAAQEVSRRTLAAALEGRRPACTGAVGGYRPGAGSAVLAAVPALERRRRKEAMGVAAAGDRRSTLPT